MAEPEVIDVEPVSRIEGNTLAAIEPTQQHHDSLVRPASDLRQIERAFFEYQELSKKLLVDSDYQDISGKRFPKRSAWRKLSVAYGVTFEIIDRVHDRDEKGRILRSEFVVRASAPNGRFADGWGACSAFERCCDATCRRRHDHCPEKTGGDCDGRHHFTHAEHDIPATAETRAKNRAAGDLFGLGEVSAEEVDTRGGEQERVSAPPPIERPVNESQMKGLHALGAKKGLTHENLSHYAKTAFGVTSLTEITFEQAGRMLDEMEKMPDADLPKDAT